VWLIDDGTTAEADLPRLEDMLDDPAFEEDDEEDDEDEEREDEFSTDESTLSEERERNRDYRKRMRNRRRVAKQMSKPPRTQVEKDYYYRETQNGLSYGASVAGLLLEMGSLVYPNAVDLR
jgi:hypothetical protein